MEATQWPAQDVQMLKTDKLVPYARNPRKHSDKQVDQIAAAIQQWGFTTAILADPDHTIIAGHGRYMAAKKLGLKEVPVMIAEGWSDTQKKAYVIADNKLAINSEWDNDGLALELAELEDVGFDIELTGFDLDEMPEIEELEPQEEPEEVSPEEISEPVTKPGDVWLLGKHRLMCGDSTNFTDFEKLMNGKKAELLHADPPYGMGKEAEGVENDNLYNEKLDQFNRDWWNTAKLFLHENASAYIWGNPEPLWRMWFRCGLSDDKLTFKNELVWDKNVGQGINSSKVRSYPIVTERCLFFMLGRQEYSTNADNYWEGWDSIVDYLKSEKDKAGFTIKDCKRIAGHSENSGCHWFDKSQWAMPTKEVYEAWQRAANGENFKKEYEQLKKEYKYFKKDYEQLKKEYDEKRAFFDVGGHYQTEIIECDRVTGEERHGHATPKPVSIMANFMQTSLKKNQLCVEPFGGSGSTLMAAEQTNRACYTMELTENYCDVIVRRWQKMTGKQAVLESTGEKYDDLKKD